MAEPDDEDLLTTQQAARVLHCSPRTLERMRRENRGPPYRTLGRYIFYVRGELKAWFKAQTRLPGAEAKPKDQTTEIQLSLPFSLPSSPT